MAGSVKDSVEQEAKEAFAVVGTELAEETAADIDGAALHSAAEELAEGIGEISSLSSRDLTPELETEYREVAESADDIVSHLVSAGLFGAIDDVLPPFDPDFLSGCLVHALQSVEEQDAPVFETAGIKPGLPGLISNALSHAEEIEQNVRWEPEKPDKISPMTTRGSTEGVVDWLDDLGRHLWMSEVLLSDQMLDDAATHTQALGAAVLLIARGAAGLGDDATDPEDDVARIVGGIALHTYHQRRIPEDLSWITDEMRSPGAWAAD